MPRGSWNQGDLQEYGTRRPSWKENRSQVCVVVDIVWGSKLCLENQGVH